MDGISQLCQKLRLPVARALAGWFGRQARSLPWRHTRDPYAIWVSEVMLQQTQVSTVQRYFGPFMKSFPTIEALAAASERHVLRHWEGLGYYRRARDLHKSARILSARHGGRLPDDPEVVASLPGFGRYTRGAVLSQAFDRRLSIVETNSRRVLCRLFGIKGDPRRGAVEGRLWKLAEALLPRQHVGDFNQALMELGALICTARRPRCDSCPLARHCRARRLNLQEAIPPRARRPLPQYLEELAVVVQRGGKVLLAQRPTSGRWAGLWEFPHGPLTGTEDLVRVAGRALFEMTAIRAEIGAEIMTLQHGIMRFRIRLICLAADYRSGTFRSSFYQQGRWVNIDRLADYPVSSPHRRLARSLASPVADAPGSGLVATT